MMQAPGDRRKILKTRGDMARAFFEDAAPSVPVKELFGAGPGTDTTQAPADSL
jgi:hypothetical protein